MIGIVNRQEDHSKSNPTSLITTLGPSVGVQLSSVQLRAQGEYTGTYQLKMEGPTTGIHNHSKAHTQL